VEQSSDRDSTTQSATADASRGGTMMMLPQKPVMSTMPSTGLTAHPSTISDTKSPQRKQFDDGSETHAMIKATEC